MRLNEIKDNPAPARCGCGSAAASAPASASRPVAAARARRRVPASRSAASKAARCRCIAGCPSAASTPGGPQKFNEINVGALQAAIDDGRLDAGKPIDVASLIAAGMLRRPKDGLRLLGDGELKAKVAITVNHASATARAAVEKAGGSITLIEKKVLAGRRGQAQEDRGQEGQDRQEEGRRRIADWSHPPPTGVRASLPSCRQVPASGLVRGISSVASAHERCRRCAPATEIAA